MNSVDTIKFITMFSDTIMKLNFLGQIKEEGDASSELAEFEISKLLSE